MKTLSKILTIIGILIIMITAIFFILQKESIKKEASDEKRYQTIKKDIDKEMERYLYYIAPNCSSENSGGHLTHKDLVYNNGFEKDKLLDVDKKSYCKAYIKYKCIEDGKWDWKTTISCKNYQDKDYKDWAEPFPDKN